MLNNWRRQFFYRVDQKVLLFQKFSCVENTVTEIKSVPIWHRGTTQHQNTLAKTPKVLGSQKKKASRRILHLILCVGKKFKLTFRKPAKLSQEKFIPDSLWTTRIKRKMAYLQASWHTKKKTELPNTSTPTHTHTHLEPDVINTQWRALNRNYAGQRTEGDKTY